MTWRIEALAANGPAAPGGSSEALQRVLAVGPARSPAPYFAGAETEARIADLLADAPDAEARTAMLPNIEALCAGRAGVVITGQQPGFLGGPLYTLYKIATAAALASRLCAAGRPTVPIFWSGDDDDDLVEAFEPVAWTGRYGLLRSEALEAARSGALQRRRIGTLQADQGHQAALTWLAGRDGTASELWTGAAAAGLTWSRLQRRAVLAACRGMGLLVVSGDEPLLHRCAASFTSRLLAGREELAGIIGRAGAAGAPAEPPIGPRSVARPFYTVDGQRRLPLPAGASVAPGHLRPGVTMRALVQDWLFAPTAVVVGPGEFAYLRQLEPAYARLGLQRSPLVPRLAAWLVPERFDVGLLEAWRDAQRQAVIETGAFDRWQASAESALAAALESGAMLPPERAQALARGRLRRWRRSLDAVARHAARDRRRAAVPRDPAWVFPDGRKQERALAWGAAWALWGQPLIDAVAAAAASHLDLGLQDRWTEFSITVPDAKE